MKKSIIFLIIVLVLSSCITDYGNKPDSLTYQGRDMFRVWLNSMTDCAYSHARPALLLEEYQTLDEAHRQNLINLYFPGKIIVQNGDLWVVLNSIDGNYNPMIEARYDTDTCWITAHNIANYYSSDFDYSQRGVLMSKFVKNSENLNLQLISERETELYLKLDNNFNVVEGNGFFFLVLGYDYYEYSDNVEMEFEILQPLFYSNQNTIIDGEIEIKVTNFERQQESVNLKFGGNYVAVTFRGITENVRYYDLINGRGYYYNYY